MRSNTIINKEAIFSEWKDRKLDRAVFLFDCGGDQMNDTTWEFYDIDDKEINVSSDLEDYLQDEVYKNVEFYVNSGDSYMGEGGEVVVKLEDDDEEPYFTYAKDSTADYCETFDDEIEIELTDEEMELVKNVILNINGGEGNNVINYKNDCILTDEQEKLIDDLVNRIDAKACDHEIENAEGERSDWYTWTTNEEGDDTEFTENGLYRGLKIKLRTQYNYSQPAEW